MSRIFVKEKVLGTHNWPDAFGAVEFLRHEHHHEFNVTVACDVTHDNRDIEFIMLRMDVKDFFFECYGCDRWIVKFGSRSCEMIAGELKLWLQQKYVGTEFTVTVSEDEIQGGVTK